MHTNVPSHHDDDLNRDRDTCNSRMSFLTRSTTSLLTVPFSQSTTTILSVTLPATVSTTTTSITTTIILTTTVALQVPGAGVSEPESPPVADSSILPQGAPPGLADALSSANPAGTFAPIKVAEEIPQVVHNPSFAEFGNQWTLLVDGIYGNILEGVGHPDNFDSQNNAP